MKQRTLVLLAGVLVIMLSFSACKPPKTTNINYFSADKRDSSHERVIQQYEARIQPSDRLQITITALNPGSALPYALPAPGTLTVDSKGDILYPQLGVIKASGLTRNELRDVLIKKLSVYLTDPVVNVDFSNFKVTVLGQVNRQGPINVADGRLTILEALGQSGDITDYGKRDSVMVIREVSGKREFGNVNLLSNEVFKSPYFTLQQNDIIFVPMVKAKAMVSEKESKPINFQTISSILGIVSTLAFLFLNFVRR